MNRRGGEGKGNRWGREGGTSGLGEGNRRSV